MNRVLSVVVGVAVAACGEPEGDQTSPGGAWLGATPTRGAVTTPALTGTSVVQLSDGRIAAADPDTDTVFMVKLGNRSPVRVTFPAHSMPVRLAQAGDALAVVLRGSGQVVRVPLDATSGAADPLWFEPGCAEPRGVAYDASSATVKLACASGELVTFGPTGRSAIDTGLELRDVMVVAGKTWVTTFRAAELLQLDAEGAVTVRLQPPDFYVPTAHFQPQVAWRTVADGKRVVMLHQLHVVEEVTRLTNPPPGAPYYGAQGCTTSVVSSALTAFDLATETVEWSSAIPGAVAVDVALDGSRIAVASVGSGRLNQYEPPGLKLGACLQPVSTQASGAPTGVTYVNHEPVWLDHDGRLLEGEVTSTGATRLMGERTLDPGRTTFHVESPSGVACASCHPEGYDDGHTWVFGPRVVRSQSLEGGLLSTAPFHWDGRFRTLGDVLDETLVARMGALKPDTSTAHALGNWLDGIPARQGTHGAPRAVKLGYLVFQRSGCAGCHSGPELTNGGTVDVGTGGKFQVPTLKALRWRGPWMHDGCALRLEDRFNPVCGGSRHGDPVAPADVPDLVEYLKTL